MSIRFIFVFCIYLYMNDFFKRFWWEAYGTSGWQSAWKAQECGTRRCLHVTATSLRPRLWPTGSLGESRTTQRCTSTQPHRTAVSRYCVVSKVTPSGKTPSVLIQWSGTQYWRLQWQCSTSLTWQQRVLAQTTGHRPKPWQPKLFP